MILLSEQNRKNYELKKVRRDLKLPNIIKGMVSNIQRFCIHDGPGIRTVVFLKGCPLNCFWCGNPELQKRENEIFYSQEKCILCKHCVEVCPAKALTIKDNKVNLNRELCNVCGICTSVCYAGALVKVSKYKSVLETFKEVVKDLGVFRQSGGGLTVSGGEPLYQVEFTLELLKLAKERNIHTALETSGYTLWNSVKKIITYNDGEFIHEENRIVYEPEIMQSLEKAITCTDGTLTHPRKKYKR